MAGKKCPKCYGKGLVRCPKCHGSRKTHGKDCDVCYTFMLGSTGTIKCECCNGLGKVFD